MKRKKYFKIGCLLLLGVFIVNGTNLTKDLFATNTSEKIIVGSVSKNETKVENVQNTKDTKIEEVNESTNEAKNKSIVAGTVAKKEVQFEKVKTIEKDSVLKEINNKKKENIIDNNSKTIIPIVEEPLPMEQKEILIQKMIEENDCVIDKEIKEVEQTIEESNIIPTGKQLTDIAYENAKTYLNSINIEEMKSKLGWTRIMCIGDSLTEGVQSGVNAPYPNSWPSVMGSLLNIPVENNGIGGSTIWTDGEDAMCERIVNCGYADAVFIMGGTNDWFFGHECPMGDKNTPNTFTHDVNKLYNIVANMYGNADVYVILPLNTNGHAGIEPYEPFDVLRDIEKTLAEEHDFHVINLNNNGMFNPGDKEIGDNYFSDFCHLNTKGYEMFGTIVAAEAICMANE